LLALEKYFPSALVRSSPDLIYLFFGRTMFIQAAYFWRTVLSSRVFSALLDRCMMWLFDWKMNNITPQDKIYLYTHLYNYTSVKQIVVRRCHIEPVFLFSLFIDCRLSSS
jgi:hypothetical protein